MEEKRHDSMNLSRIFTSQGCRFRRGNYTTQSFKKVVYMNNISRSNTYSLLVFAANEDEEHAIRRVSSNRRTRIRRYPGEVSIMSSATIRVLLVNPDTHSQLFNNWRYNVHE